MVTAISRNNIEQILSDISKVILTNKLSPWRGGEFIKKFEGQWAALSQTARAVMTNSGTSALHCAFIAAGIQPGDHVLIPAAGYVSAASAVIQAGGIPVICDIDPVSWSLDFNDARSRITPKTKAVVAIHMWGIPNPMHDFVAFAQEFNLTIIEDCSQSHFAQIGKQSVGSFGLLSTYSLAPGKFISTGQGGIVAGNDVERLERVRRLIAKGKGDHWHDYREMGFSYEATELQAIIGLYQLKDVKKNIEKRIEFAHQLRTLLQDGVLQFKLAGAGATPSYFKLPVLFPEKHRHLILEYLDQLKAENVNIRQTHPPMHRIAWLHAFTQKDNQAHIINQPRPAADAIIPGILEIDANIQDEEMLYSMVAAITKVNTRLNLS